ncbi:aromatic ring-hydroxylating dioxygenase subunit alpha [Oceanicella sp. SM1341]|uniref:aromatic ring-hydroxylating dioxygenase subunit alpha n=1 Tax=Oceanicella sp. SM1341 TaxID=1548889 RepID=UPI000E513890|nr:aromatic ring-hydroxylating dioxygenase subunit alpha [Oceanicella sp. SM1341]
MSKYASNPDAIRALVRPEEVHRDVYTSPEVFRLEMRHLFANTWVYVGHASQIPEKGDYITTEIGDQPVLVVRHTDMSVHVLYNRCPHKGVKIASEACGNTGKFFRCPYHAWSFKTNGNLLAIPLKKGYENTGLENSEAVKGLAPVAHVKVYRDFIFARLNDAGESFEEFFGESLSSIDNMIDRSPEGKLVLEGAPLRYMHNCNWKMLVENQTDTCHPMVAHESSAGTAVSVWEKEQAKGGPKPMAVEVYAPFMAPYEFFEGMGIRVWPHGHGHTGVTTSIHADYSAVPGYFDQMVETYGEERARQILGENRHNTVYFPHIMVKGPIQTLRLFKPIAADKTLVESYTFRLVGAPDMLFERTLMYNRLINAPTSIVGHDDLEVYERAQKGLAADALEWVNVQRLYEPGEDHEETAIANGTSERQMRNQFAAWVHYMTLDMEEPARVEAAE